MLKVSRRGTRGVTSHCKKIFNDKRLQSSFVGRNEREDSFEPIVRGPIMTNAAELEHDFSRDELLLLEQGIKKSDELAAQFTNYRYKFKKLPTDYGSNQLLAIEPELQKNLESVVSTFKAPVKYAFGYGSGVFQQSGYSKSQDMPQIDIIFGVSHPDHFHSLNVRQNPHHYSSLRFFGSKFISQFQEVGAGVYFNPFVDINGQVVKYGVVSMDTLLKDLATWNSFYLAGRLQKPVKVLKNDLSVQYWNQLNLKAAATLAKHLIQKDSSKPLDEFEFYKKITALSYAGDVRYNLGAENPDKVKNIVEKNFVQFQDYYRPIYKDVIVNNSHYLPQGFTLENSIDLLEKRIFRNSTLQTVKGVFTAGITKSIRYAWAKRLKAMKRAK
ncbi:LAME_0G02278g1_1 [Lachancea meyersii CBS 8951]|uniref:Phosphatidate cytidylyltransferase, mitochondrial n=1 Tax=Lachancea meyersii CBS 8951 TaxID=1266667 RepID=A0A1G4K627_9SACH|nr:LAME_0G02278g1_1 [Lachancea meyersii CBS 8951]